MREEGVDVVGLYTLLRGNPLTDKDKFSFDWDMVGDYSRVANDDWDEEWEIQINTFNEMLDKEDKANGL